MRALELQTLDGPDGLVVVDRPDPPAEGQVLIDVHAAGVCFPDLLITQGRYQLKPELPWIPGLEVAGLVRSAPPDSGVAVGSRVWTSVGAGGFASVAAAYPPLVQPLPEEVSYSQGAALGVNFCTAVFALFTRGGLESGETVLVTGAAGGLGTALSTVASHAGARVIAVVSGDAKAETARAAGADAVVLGAAWKDQVLELTDGRGVDLVADVAGGDATLEAVRCTARGGRVLVLGFPAGIPQIPTNRLLLRNISLIGAGLGEYARIEADIFITTSGRVTEMLRAGLRPLVGASYPLADGAEALRALENRTAQGKLVLTV